MNNHKTKLLGDIGLSKVIARLIELGYYVYTPISDTPPNDLLISDGNGRNISVEVKARTKLNRKIYKETAGYYEISLYTSSTKRFKNNKKKLTCDLLAVYLVDDDDIIFIKSNIIQTQNSISIKSNEIQTYKKLLP